MSREGGHSDRPFYFPSWNLQGIQLRKIPSRCYALAKGLSTVGSLSWPDFGRAYSNTESRRHGNRRRSCRRRRALRLGQSSFLSAVVGILVSGFAIAVVRRKTRWILEAKGIRTTYGSFHPWSSIGNFQAWTPRFGLALLSFDRADVSDSFKIKINRWIFRRDDAELIDPGGLTRLELEDLVNSWYKLAAEFD
jgi:hypothetical protein